jgi:hypothetical protein
MKFGQMYRFSGSEGNGKVNPLSVVGQPARRATFLYVVRQWAKTRESSYGGTLYDVFSTTYEEEVLHLTKLDLHLLKSLLQGGVMTSNCQ